MSNLTITIAVIWISGAIATSFSKDSSCLGASLFATIVIGFGYLL